MTLQVRNPYDQSIACELAYDGARDLEEKLGRAAGAFRAWRELPVDERCRQVARGLEHFRREGNEIARQVSLQMGKPLAQARAEVKTLLERAEHMLSIAEASLAPDVVPAREGFELRIEHVPLGVVFNLAAWNYPLIIPVNVVVPALLAGNAVILKHSARTPLCGLAFERAFGDLEVPGVVSHAVVTHEQAASLIADPRIAHVAFTGSVPGGRSIYRAAAGRARGFIDCGLELGGKDPAYVAADADLDFTVPAVVDGACYNAGQSCCAVERVYVHEKVHDEFLDRARHELGQYRLGDPLREETTLGPLASREQLDFLEDQVRDAQRRGAGLLLGGARVPATAGNFFPPTLLAGVPNEASVMQEESFGPLLPVRRVRDDGEALELMNESRYGLTASVWTRDRDRAERFAQRLEAGTVYQNRCDYLHPGLPWTGYGESGKGSSLSRYGFFHLTKRKSIHFRRNDA